ncbi:MAG TPA: outer membrane lipoprotein carrier protein LolA [Rhizomicrobium sp.]|nr:outer membrane lipoprotein carrier protein LolA [Rhizomicrobium sp.]
MGNAGAAGPQLVKTGQILRGRFTLNRQLAGFAKPLRSEGSFSLIPGRGLIWHAQTPFENVTVITSDGVSTRVNGQETMRLPAARMPGIGHLYEVLGGAVSGNVALLQQDFSVNRTTDAAGWHLVLTPLHPDTLTISQIGSLAVAGHRFVESIEIDKAGGDVDRMSFVGQTVETALPTAEERALLESLHK